jgi:hypothetical protein
VSVVPIAAAPSYRQEREVPLTYEQLRDHLHELGLGRPSKRWLQYRRVEGMPSVVTVTGSVRFLPSEVVPWLRARADKTRRVG